MKTQKNLPPVLTVEFWGDQYLTSLYPTTASLLIWLIDFNGMSFCLGVFYA